MPAWKEWFWIYRTVCIRSGWSSILLSNEVKLIGLKIIKASVYVVIAK